jgi:uncharacterized BrkB/YihY/UPF0761 family membrane protein
MDTLNAEYEVHQGRSFIKKNAVALGLTLAVAILLIAAVTIVLAGGPTGEAFSGGIVKMAIKICAAAGGHCSGVARFCFSVFFCA